MRKHSKDIENSNKSNNEKNKNLKEKIPKLNSAINFYIERNFSQEFKTISINEKKNLNNSQINCLDSPKFPKNKNNPSKLCDSLNDFKKNSNYYIEETKTGVINKTRFKEDSIFIEIKENLNDFYCSSSKFLRKEYNFSENDVESFKLKEQINEDSFEFKKSKIIEMLDKALEHKSKANSYFNKNKFNDAIKNIIM